MCNYELNGVTFTDEMHSSALGIISRARNQASKAGFDTEETKEWERVKLRDQLKLDDDFDYVLGVLQEQARRAREYPKQKQEHGPDAEDGDDTIDAILAQIEVLKVQIEKRKELIEQIKNKPKQYNGKHIAVHRNSDTSWQVRQRRGDRISILTHQDLDLCNKIAERIDAVVDNILQLSNGEV